MKKYLLVNSLLFIFLALPGFGQNPRNIMIDDITATACSHCACMDSVLNRIVKVRHPNTIILGIQGPSSLFYLPKMDSLMFALGFDGTGAKVNRQYDEQSVTSIADSVDARYAASPQAPVKIEITSKSFDAQTRMVNISIKVTSLADNLNGLFRINMAITEDLVMGPQQHDPGCPGGDPYPFTLIPHYNVMRDIILTTHGEMLIDGIWTKDLAITRSYSFKLDSAALVPGNSNIVIYVDKKGDTLGQSPIQQAIVQSVTRPVGISEDLQEQNGSLFVYPNPSNGMTTFRLTMRQESVVSLFICNAIGQERMIVSNRKMSAGMNDIPYDVSELAPGVYSVILKTINDKIYTKLIIL
ncbi:MAG: Omp28-related outer membrane protein [Bacteroidales bacterium]|nr:Omp28-related outer membrane protein [Bacteroidales bacterium]